MFFGRLRRTASAQVRSRLGAGAIVAMDESANCFGVESRGVMQIRGNGCLGATHDDLLFIMWLPRREVHIPRDRITAVERTKWHLGKTVARDLLLVRFTNEQGSPDSVAWRVRDLPLWEAVLSS